MKQKPTDGVSIEKKQYTMSELSGLQGKFRKIETVLSLDEEKNEGKSIMLNMKTSVFETMKMHLMKLLIKHPVVKSVKPSRTAKASTDIGIDADTEYHLDVEFAVDANEHLLKLKIYNTNCRVQIQHVGKRDYQAQSYLANRCPPKYFAEEVMLPFCRTIEDTISDEKEKDFIAHLKNEIQRLKKVGKAEVKTKGQCLNQECKSKNALDMNNVESYGTCTNCNKMEHFRCAQVETHAKKSYIEGSMPFLCSGCLKGDPSLALQRISMNVPEKSMKPVMPAIVEAVETEEAIIVEISDETEKSQHLSTEECFKCEICSIITKTKSQLEIHVRIQHTDVGKFSCSECEYITDTENMLATHKIQKHDSNNLKVNSPNTQSSFKCKHCDYSGSKTEDLELHVFKTHGKTTFCCSFCELELPTISDLKSHVSSSHTGNECSKKCKEYDLLEQSYKALKENYERLVTLTKKEKEQIKDKEYAMEIQIEELRNGFERVKGENVKLQDNLDTQNKLWKM